MPSQNLIDIIVKIEDQASETAKKIGDQLGKFGDQAQKSNQKATQSAQMTEKQMQDLSKKVGEVSKSTAMVGQKGASQFKRYDSAVQGSIVKFNSLDDETKQWLDRLAHSSNPKVFYDLNSKCQEAVSKFNELENQTDTWAGSLANAKSKLSLLGNDTDGLKGKIQTTGTAIGTYIGGKWDGIKNKITNVGGVISSKLGSALQSVRSKIDTLGSAFSGLGGVISSVFGGIGLEQLGQMTLGASISRDRIKSLSEALLGAGQSTEYFNELWNKMDQDTNSSLVSLDQLSQSLSVVKQMTGATGDSLTDFEGIVLDIGQRAILMGKQGEDAMTVMQSAGKGLNGEFETLKENFGITKDKLEQLGWDGSAEDIDGYTGALQKALDQSGDVNGMMDTSYGKITSLKKMWSVAGRSLGDEFKPYLDQATTSLLGFLDANNDGALDESGKQWLQYGYGLMAVSSGFMTFAPSISPALSVLDNMAGKTKSVLRFVGLLEAEEGALTLATLWNSAVTKVSTFAHSVYATVLGLLSGEIGLVTVATQIWNAVLSANPVMLVVIALIALTVAIYEVGKAFGWWSNVQEMLGAMWSGVNRLWSAFINHPDVQAFIQELGKAWNWLASSIGWVFQKVCEFFDIQTNGNFDIISALIQGVGGAWDWLKGTVGWVVGVFTNIYNAFNTVMNALGPFANALLFLGGPVGAVVGILRTVVCILLGCSPGIVPALEKVQEVFTTVWNGIVGFLSGVIASVLTALQPVIDILTAIGSFIAGQFMQSWNTFIQIVMIVSSGIQTLMGIFVAFLNGQISFSSALSMVWATLSAMFRAVLVRIIARVISFGASLVSLGLSVAGRFVNAVINFVSTLPGRVGSYLLSVLSGIVSTGASWISSAGSTASSMVSAVINHVSQLPGKVYTEFMNIGSRIVSAGSDLINKAKNIGKNIVDGLLGAMGIHSPGIIQEKVVLEFKNMVGGVKNFVKPATETAEELGNAIVDGFGDPDLGVNMDPLYKDLDAPEVAPVNVGVDVSQMGAIDTSNQQVSASFTQLATDTQNTLSQMVNTDKMAYDMIRQNDSTQMSMIKTDTTAKLGQMTASVRTNMNQIVSKNKTGMESAKNTTKTQLNHMVEQTKKANSSMISAWQTMTNGIVKSADKIKTDSTAHFNKLEGTIGSFYRKLQNPSGFGAGPGNGRVSTVKRMGSNRGFKNITSAIRQAQMPKFVSLGEMRRNPLISTANVGEYIQKGDNNMFSTADLVRSGNIRIPIGLEDPKNRRGKGAGWDNFDGSHTSKIKNTSKEWGMKGPKIIGKYPTSTNFKVKDFMNGVPKIDFNTFKGMAEDVFSQCHYEFYYDSNKYGNWMNAFQHGGMNCSDSSDALIAMAHACGLSASKVHGHWNQYGHYWATVEGHKMDTTGWMQRRNWTPASSHAGPGPKQMTFGMFIDELKTAFASDQKETVVENTPTSDTMVVSGEMKITHDFVNLPENISADEVARLIHESTDDESWIRKLVQNVKFQKADLKEKLRIEGKNNRARGI